MFVLERVWACIWVGWFVIEKGVDLGFYRVII